MSLPENFLALDFETQPIAFFEKKRKGLNAAGHPRHARPFIMTTSDGRSAKLYRNPTRSNVLLSPTIICHNLSFDWIAGKNAGVFMQEDLQQIEFHCTRTMARIACNLSLSSLKALAKEHLGWKPTSYSDAVKSDGDTFEQYAIDDAKMTAELFPTLKRKLESQGQWALYSCVELPFLFVNSECQSNGFAVDVDVLQKMERELELELSHLRGSIDSGTNFNSPSQVQALLFGKHELPVTLLRGKPSTSRKALVKLADVPVVQNLLRLKALSADLRQLRQISQFIDRSSSAVHPYIDTLGADTGRCTSQKPNLQNISKGAKLRKLFVARPGHLLAVFDFGQIEPRTLAHFLGPGALNRAIVEGGDIYSKLGQAAFSSASSKIPARNTAKLVLLATMYGSGDKTLAEQLSVSLAEAKAIRIKFFSAFPEVLRFQQECVAFARQNGFVAGLLGRRRYIRNLNSTDEFERFRAERQVLNAVIQGSAATIFKSKLVELRKELPDQVRFLHHVHDEVILEVPEGEAEHWLLEAGKILERPVSWFSIPLVVEGGIGVSWGDAKKSGKEVKKNEIAKSGSLSDRERLETQSQG